MSIAFELIHKNNMNKYFNRADYQKAFENYTAVCRPCFNALPDDAAELERLAVQGMDELEAFWNSQWLFRRNAARCDDRVMYAAFFSPAAREHGETALRYAEMLREKWIARYPGEPFESADYETILKGFEPTTILGFKIR